MTELPEIVVTGAAGRMGQMLIRAVAESDKVRLGGALVRPGHDWVGQDVGTAMGGAPIGVIATDDAVAAFATARAVIDFTTPSASVEFARLAAQARAVHIIGTTGFEKEHLAAFAPCARHAVIVRAGNMGLGINLLTQMVRKAAQALDMDWDIEVIEAHHNRKVDAPSGTALMLGQAAANGRGIDMDTNMESGRDGMTGPRAKGAIGFSAIRGGDIVGEHDVMFATAASA